MKTEMIVEPVQSSVKYKQTEIGLIPEDWKTQNVFSIAEFKKELFDDGDWIEAEHLSEKGIRLIQTGNIGVGKFIDKESRKYISSSTFTKLKCKKLKIGDILICRLAEPAGRACIFKYTSEIEAITSVDVTIFRPSVEMYSREFINQYFATTVWLNSVLENVGGTTHKRISRSALGRLYIPLPPLSEQTAIAEALSDADAMIASLEKLIDKKKKIKQGAMQELLRPKEGWVKRKIRDISVVGRGRVISHKEISAARTGMFPVYSSQTSNNGIMGYIDTFDFEGEYVTWTTDGEKAGTVFFREGRFNCTNVCGTIKLKKDNAQFVALMLGIEAPKHVSRNLANPKLMNEPMKNIEIFLPPAEIQIEIAEKILEIELEIDTCITKLEKMICLKQGMMQNLLTGKIRLV